MSNQTQNKSHAGGIIMLIIILLVVVGMSWAYFARQDNMNQKLEDGCIPLTADRYGIATSYSCPNGVIRR
jgi:hypothetical protein